MHIMFFKQGETKPYKTPNDVALDDGETIDFNETSIANCERDDDVFTVYTEGGYFYITFDENDIVQLASMLTPDKKFELLEPWAIQHIKESGTDMVEASLTAWVTKCMRKI